MKKRGYSIAMRIRRHLVLLIFSSYLLLGRPIVLKAFRSRSICGYIPGLKPSQRRLCRQRPAVIAAAGWGAQMTVIECKRQMKRMRWNCSPAPSEIGLLTGQITLDLGWNRESAFVTALTSAGVTFAITQWCSRGELASSCGCDRVKWKWGGCGVNAGYGMRIARKLLKQETNLTIGQLQMLWHNHRAGRKIVLKSLKVMCKCHGISASCSIRTCWRLLPPFQVIGDNLLLRYRRARRIVSSTKSVSKMDALVFLETSPNYCEADSVHRKWTGTTGRVCDLSLAPGGCGQLCCGRGYDIHLRKRRWNCNCKFHWCCHVRCHNCSAVVEEYTCK